MVNDTNPDHDVTNDDVSSDSVSNAADVEAAPARTPRRRASAPKSAGAHASVDSSTPAFDSSVEPVETNAPTDAKPAKKPKGEKKSKADKPPKAEKPAKSARSAKDGKAASAHAPAKSAAPVPTTALLFQAPPLPTPIVGDNGSLGGGAADGAAPRSSSRTRGNSGGNSNGNSSGGNSNADTNDPAVNGNAGGGDEPSSAARRRTRRRSGDAPREGEDSPNTTVRVRQPRQAPAPITEPQRVKGSTRLEAKKQRRRDGRDAGRRRPVITEAEFLARRESVDRSMVVRSKYGRIQIGVLEDGVLVEHYVARAADASLIGNVYLGRVQNVLPSMEAAFVDIGRGRNAVLYSGEVDWEAAQAQADEDGRGQQARRIELALKPGDKVLVQVTKDPVGHKGARLTSQISLPGRYLVYVPNGSMNGISRKLPDTERARLKKILKEVLPDDAGVIVRTAAEGATEEQLTLDVSRLTAQWASISAALQNVQAPALLHSEPDLLIKIVRDVFNEDFQKLVVDGDDALETISTYVTAVAPDLADRLERYKSETDSFDAHRISEQIEKALDRKVWLPSGGSLVIDRTEAMTVVDVNTGKFVGSGGNLEETVTKNNLEAAEEIVRQLRLRDIGGIIVVDFIDMVLETNRDLVLRRLVECLSRDRTKHQVAEVTSLGLVQMTRKKLGLGLLESFSENCEVCAGRGIVVHHEPVFKHRPQQSEQPSQNGAGGSSRNRRGRGGSGGGMAPSNAPKNGHGPSGTHAITDDVRNALAQIAKSTVPHHDESAVAEDGRESAAEVSTGSIDGGSTPSADEASTGSTSEVSNKIEQAAGAAAEAAVQILDIPVNAHSRSSRRISTQDAEQILGSVLEALPEPTQPGKSRGRRSRRASSSGAVVTPSEGTEG